MWRRHRFFGAITLLLLVFCIPAAVAHRRSVRVKEVTADIRSHGGSFVAGGSTYETIRRRILGDRFPMARSIGLWGAYFDKAWLKQNDYLSGLGIEGIGASDCPLNGADFARIIDGNPIRGVRLQGIQDADRVAVALARSGSSEEVALHWSDLTDTGFRRLPLEKIRDLSIDGTTVTPRGLEELRRCEKLECLTLDGKQFDAHVARVLSSLPTLTGLALRGMEVNDQQLGFVNSIERLAYFELLEFENSQVTRAAIRSLRTERPELEFFLDGDFADAEVIDALP